MEKVATSKLLQSFHIRSTSDIGAGLCQWNNISKMIFVLTSTLISAGCISIACLPNSISIHDRRFRCNTQKDKKFVVQSSKYNQEGNRYVQKGKRHLICEGAAVTLIKKYLSCELTVPKLCHQRSTLYLHLQLCGIVGKCGPLSFGSLQH
jgi:hypothetical protein